MFAATAKTTNRLLRNAPEALSALGFIAVLVSRCAVPVAPTGGPPDQQPPDVVTMVPENNAVNVTAQAIRLTFSEHVDEGSLQQALEITPPPTQPPDMKWSGRAVEIRFKTPLESNTTYILTINTRLRDLRGVSLKSPITRAFSTGPKINSGKIRGRILDPVLGRGRPGVQVFAYATADIPAEGPLPERPLYYTETDSQGNFELNYLSDRPYYVVGVTDRNNNKMIDNLELVAVPPLPAIVADSVGSPIGAPWYQAVLDTVAPEVRRVESLSDRQIAVRYSENVLLKRVAVEDWIVMDSSAVVVDSAWFVYQRVDERRSVFVMTRPLQAGEYLLRPGAAADSAGNAAPTTPVNFSASGRPDTTRPRFASFLPEITAAAVTTLLPGQRPGLQFSMPIASAEARLLVSVEDSAGAPVAYDFDEAEDVTHYLRIDTRRLRSFTVRVRTPGAADSVATRRYTAVSVRDLGGVTAILAGVPDTSTIRIEARRAATREARGTATATGKQRFTITGLPQGSYRLRLFRDDNRNGVWDAARLFPFRTAEPLFWPADSVRVRPRWDTDLDTLRIEGFGL